ncbi:imidazoleglycerol-phosphate dehydratase, partial [Halalkalibacterium halodurans]|nr:imidazoleglycerol-phosphate dehydratase [Halalkalibacterium halodurans]
MRKATIERKTGETQISLTFAVDGEGQSNLTTGVP